MEEKTNKVQENLKAWCSPPLEFPTKEAEKAYKERTRRIADAVLLKKPDRIPITPMWEFFYATYPGYSCEDIMYDPKKAEGSATAIKAPDGTTYTNVPSTYASGSSTVRSYRVTAPLRNE